MFDTTTINYGIEKLSTAFSKLEPTIKTVSSKYVEFVVFQTITESIIVFICFVISCLLWIPLLRYGKGKNGFTNYDETAFSIPFILLTVTTISLAIATLIDINQLVLAFNCPEMYTIQKLIGKAK
jgi:hypothetical protein